jgi:hypothetical protein
MARSTKEAWLTGPADLKEADVDNVPVEGQSVRVRGLPAAYSNQATSEALELKNTPNGDQIATVNQSRLEILQFTHGVIEPQFNEQEATIIATRFGPAFKKIIAKIDELSGVDKEAIERAEATFPSNGASASGKAGAKAASGGS